MLLRYRLQPQLAWVHNSFRVQRALDRAQDIQAGTAFVGHEMREPDAHAVAILHRTAHLLRALEVPARDALLACTRIN
jgi:hypothetical protein